MADELAVYGGRTMIGTTQQIGPHAFVARSLRGEEAWYVPRPGGGDACRACGPPSRCVLTSTSA